MQCLRAIWMAPVPEVRAVLLAMARRWIEHAEEAEHDVDRGSPRPAVQSPSIKRSRRLRASDAGRAKHSRPDVGRDDALSGKPGFPPGRQGAHRVHVRLPSTVAMTLRGCGVRSGGGLRFEPRLN